MPAGTQLLSSLFSLPAAEVQEEEEQVVGVPGVERAVLPYVSSQRSFPCLYRIVQSQAVMMPQAGEMDMCWIHMIICLRKMAEQKEITSGRADLRIVNYMKYFLKQGMIKCRRPVMRILQ